MHNNMNGQPLPVFQRLVATLQATGANTSKESLALYMEALSPFSDDVRMAAITSVAMNITKFPAPAHFAQAALKIVHCDGDSLKNRGKQQFDKLYSLGSDAHSVLCDDWRLVYAVTTAFGSISGFFNCRDKQEWMQNVFADAYASVDFFLEYTVQKEYLLDNGIPSSIQGAYRPLLFLGDYNRCAAIFQTLPTKEQFAMPSDPSKQIIEFVPENLTKEQMQANKSQIEALIASLSCNRGSNVEAITA